MHAVEFVEEFRNRRPTRRQAVALVRHAPPASGSATPPAATKAAPFAAPAAPAATSAATPAAADAASVAPP